MVLGCHGNLDSEEGAPRPQCYFYGIYPPIDWSGVLIEKKKSKRRGTGDKVGCIDIVWKSTNTNILTVHQQMILPCSCCN